MTIGEKIKYLREKNGLTQPELAKKIHTTKQTIFKYENGITDNIPYDKIEALAKTLGVTPAYLMGWDEAENFNVIDPAKLSGEQRKLAEELVKIFKIGAYSSDDEIVAIRKGLNNYFDTITSLLKEKTEGEKQ